MGFLEKVNEQITIMHLENQQRRNATSFDDVNSKCESLIIEIEDSLQDGITEMRLEELKEEFYSSQGIEKERLYSMELELIELLGSSVVN